MKVIINEEKIVTACLNGDRKAQEQLYNLFAGKMYGVCLRYAHCPEKAADYLQDGFVKVFNNLSKFQFDGSFEGWIRRVMVNTALDDIRKTSRLQVINDYDEQIADNATNGILDQMGAEDIMELIQGLPQGYRAVFNLYCIEGYAHKEIAEMLNINEGTSKSQLNRAKAMLKSKLIDNNRYNEIAAQ